MKIKLMVVVPAFNEGSTIYRTANEIFKHISKLADVKLLIVNDGSVDDTQLELEKLKSLNASIEILSLCKNKGYGGALIEGYKLATHSSTHVLFMDSDLTNCPSDIFKFLDAFKGGADYVKASRFEKGGGMIGVSKFRQYHSKLGAFIARLLFDLPISDPTNGFRALKVGLIDYEQIKSHGFSMILDELYLINKNKNLKIVNIPVVLGARGEGQKKSSFSYGVETYIAYLKPALLSFYERIFK